MMINWKSGVTPSQSIMGSFMGGGGFMIVWNSFSGGFKSAWATGCNVLMKNGMRT